MIIGLAVELVDLERFARAEDRFGERLRRRLFTDEERASSPRLESRAARFAAKVAARRALGMPLGGWHEVRILGGGGRAPELRFAGASERRARELGVARTLLSLSHDAGACVGHVVLDNGAG